MLGDKENTFWFNSWVKHLFSSITDYPFTMAQIQNEYIQQGCLNFRLVPVMFPNAAKVRLINTCLGEGGGEHVFVICVNWPFNKPLTITPALEAQVKPMWGNKTLQNNWLKRKGQIKFTALRRL